LFKQHCPPPTGAQASATPGGMIWHPAAHVVDDSVAKFWQSYSTFASPELNDPPQ